MLPAMRTGDNDHALIVDEVVHGVWKTEEMCPPDIVEHRRELRRVSFD
jgi:hypothetical protein